MISAFGENLSARQWSERRGIKRQTILRRMRLGWAPEDAVTAPVERLSSWRDEHAIVLAGAASGESAHQTAERLGWSDERVLRMRRAAIRLLGVRNITQAVFVARERGLIAGLTEAEEVENT